MSLAKKKIIPQLALSIHEHLHTRGAGSELIIKTAKGDKIRLEIIKDSEGCDYILYDGFTFKKQSRRLDSYYSHLARAGKRITWITGNQRTLRIVEDTIYFEDSIYKKPK